MSPVTCLLVSLNFVPYNCLPPFNAGPPGIWWEGKGVGLEWAGGCGRQGLQGWLGASSVVLRSDL